MTDDPRGLSWEWFNDPGYCHMWCVRLVGNRDFRETFHLTNEAEARRLAELLTALAAATQRAKTAQQAECEASQSGPKGQRPTSSTQSGVR